MILYGMNKVPPAEQMPVGLVFLFNRKLRQRETFQGEFAEANSLEPCSREHGFCCDSSEHVFIQTA